jgi:hypothetical protein
MKNIAFLLVGLMFNGTAVTAPWQVPFVSNTIQTLTASPDGGPWIGFIAASKGLHSRYQPHAP